MPAKREASKIEFSNLFFHTLRLSNRPSWYPSELWYRIKCVLWYRYRVVKPRYLGRLWEEYNVVLAHAMFEVLSRFVEEDCSKEIVDWYSEECPLKVTVDGHEKHVFDEIQELYEWWHTVYNREYPAQQAAIEKEIDGHAPKRICHEKNGSLVYDPQFSTKHDEETSDAAYKRLHQLDACMAEELDARLHRLLNVRRYMWT